MKYCKYLTFSENSSSSVPCGAKIKLSLQLYANENIYRKYSSYEKHLPQKCLNAYVFFGLFVYSLETYKYKYAEENLSIQSFRGGRALFIR